MSPWSSQFPAHARDRGFVFIELAVVLGVVTTLVSLLIQSV